MRSSSRKKYKIRYFFSSSKDEAGDDAEINENTETDENAETIEDTKINENTETDENTDNNKIKFVISVLDRPMRSVVARKIFRKSLPYHTKQ